MTLSTQHTPYLGRGRTGDPSKNKAQALNTLYIFCSKLSIVSLSPFSPFLTFLPQNGTVAREFLQQCWMGEAKTLLARTAARARRRSRSSSFRLNSSRLLLSAELARAATSSGLLGRAAGSRAAAPNEEASAFCFREGLREERSCDSRGRRADSVAASAPEFSTIFSKRRCALSS